MWLNNILESLGNTPLVKLQKITQHLPCTVLAKLEYFNPGNSTKDRIAINMLEDAEKQGKIKPGGTIIECTSGNTGMGLALAACVKGYKCIFTTTDKQSKEKADILKAVGAEVIVCPTDVAPEDPKSYYSVAKRLAKEIPNSFHFNQYDNLSNRAAHYKTTGPEIWQQTEGKITHLVCTAGTGGTVTGTAMYLKEKNPNIKIWAIDVYGSLLTHYYKTGEVDMSKVHPYISEGFGEDFVPQNYNMNVIDHFEQVTDKDGAVMARRLAKEEGMFCGYSAGSCLQGLLQLTYEFNPDDVVVCIFHDHGSRYVAKIYNDEWMLAKGFIQNKNAKDIISNRPKNPLIKLQHNDSVQKAIDLMLKFDIENIPIFENEKPVGSLSEKGIFKQLMKNQEIKKTAISNILEPNYNVVNLDTSIDVIKDFIDRLSSAVLVKDDLGDWHIITQYDILKNI